MSALSQGVGVDSETLADVADKLSDVLDADAPGRQRPTHGTWLAALRVVGVLHHTRRQHPQTPITTEELRVSTLARLI